MKLPGLQSTMPATWLPMLGHLLCTSLQQVAAICVELQWGTAPRVYTGSLAAQCKCSLLVCSNADSGKYWRALRLTLLLRDVCTNLRQSLQQTQPICEGQLLSHPWTIISRLPNIDLSCFCFRGPSKEPATFCQASVCQPGAQPAQPQQPLQRAGWRRHHSPGAPAAAPPCAPRPGRRPHARAAAALGPAG